MRFPPLGCLRRRQRRRRLLIKESARPPTDPNGEPFWFRTGPAGYAGNGLFSSEEDIYNPTRMRTRCRGVAAGRRPVRFRYVPAAQGRCRPKLSNPTSHGHHRAVRLSRRVSRAGDPTPFRCRGSSRRWPHQSDPSPELFAPLPLESAPWNFPRPSRCKRRRDSGRDAHNTRATQGRTRTRFAATSWPGANDVSRRYRERLS